jgi:hypothetical protein
MPDLKFSTNIKCSGCVEKITLTITHAQPISAKAVIAALEKAGYQAKTTSNQ